VDPEVNRPEPPEPREVRRDMRVMRMVVRLVVLGFLLAAAVLVLWRLVGPMLVGREMSDSFRDAETDILRGAEPRELGPPDSPRAALFIHGFAGAGDNFADVPDLLAERGWRVRVLRLPGHGTTPKDLERTTNEELLEAVREEFESLRAQHDTVVLVGHSMGSTLATLLAAEGGVDGLVLGAPYYGVTHRWYYGLKPETWDRILARPVRWVYKGKLFLRLNKRQNAKYVTSYAMLPMRSLRRLHDLADQAVAPGVLEAIDCPVLMLCAPGDAAASPKAARRAYDRLGSEDKSWVELPRSNHHIFWDYDQEQVREEILRFLARFEDSLQSDT
jgi:carboxylesterase